MKEVDLLFLVFLFPTFGIAQHLRIYHIDVEQGGATLFVSPGNKTLLVYAGKNGHGPSIKAVMEQAGVEHMKYFVNTHYCEDHFGGIDDLVNAGIAVDEVFDRGDKNFIGSKVAQKNSHAYYVPVKVGKKIGSIRIPQLSFRA